jgi:alpha-glucosidase (family GH31 glycosyl hydrolase)
MIVVLYFNSGTLNVHQVCSAFFKHNTLIAGVLIKDWTGVKCNLTSSLPTGSTGLVRGGKNCGNNTMWYNWVLERAHYPKWQSLVDSLERRGISVGLYICPHLEEIPKHLNSGRRHLFAEVHQDDFFVKKNRANNSAAGKSAMSSGETTSKQKLAGRGGRKGGSNQDKTVMYNQFKRTKCGILDPTNFNATSWFKKAVREEVFSFAGASFWMTEMGIGGPPVDGVYTTPNAAPDHSISVTTGMASSEGESKTSSAGLSFHNSYAEKWAKGES